jgi:hypothetical protein
VGVVCLGLLLRAAAPTLVDLEGHSRAALVALTPAQTFGLGCALLASVSYSLLGVLYERTAALAGGGLSHSKVGALLRQRRAAVAALCAALRRRRCCCWQRRQQRPP